MAVSGSKNYAVTRADIIEGALRKLGVFDQGAAIPGEETNAADQALNLMVKELTARGADIWLRDEITVFLQPNTESYSLGTANAASTYVETTLSAAASSGTTSLSVSSATGMAASDYVGVKLDDDTIHWTTISSISSTTLTIATATDGAASSGNRVYTYTTTAGRPTKIVYAFRRDKNGIDTELKIIGNNEYFRLSDKDANGPPVKLWYQPTITTGKLRVWPTDGGSTTDKIVLIAQYYPDDFDAASDNPQFPVEWGNTLVWNLAAELSSEYGIPEREQGRLWQVAEHKLNELLDFDVENASVILSFER